MLSDINMQKKKHSFPAGSFLSTRHKLAENSVTTTFDNNLFIQKKVLETNYFIKTHSRINCNYSEKREKVDSSDQVSTCQVHGLQTLRLQQATASLQMQLHGHIWTWAGRSELPGRRRNTGQVTMWNKALLLLHAVFTLSSTQCNMQLQ